LGWLVGEAARLWLRTLRLSFEVDPALAAASARPWVLAFWHGQQLALLRYRRRRRTVALVSLSLDGELQAAALPRVGLAIARGSSSRGGASGLRAIVRALRLGDDAAFAVDGPRGPRCIVHSDGALTAARLAGGVVVPFAAAPAHAWKLRSWDRFELPRPFSRVAVVLGAPLEPATTSRAALGQALAEASLAARRAFAGVDPRLDVPTMKGTAS
jgi:lysophospholipid acyltransferase (LPLAT)-like uncharacterized protein